VGTRCTPRRRRLEDLAAQYLAADSDRAADLIRFAGSSPDAPTTTQNRAVTTIAELERALEERRSMEMNLQRKRAELDLHMSPATQEIGHLEKRIEHVEQEIEALHDRDERTGEQEHELTRLQQQMTVLSQQRADLERGSEELECMRQTHKSTAEGDCGAGFDRELLLEALDDAENELYAEGARRYARRLAERVRDGEFD
jgi:predicted RNase H-like nuclease (RuvC/YqgF family)